LAERRSTLSSIDLTLIDRKPETIVVMISGENRTILEG